jgi:cell division septum initiation protein DivIVA
MYDNECNDNALVRYPEFVAELKKLQDRIDALETQVQHANPPKKKGGD